MIHNIDMRYELSQDPEALKGYICKLADRAWSNAEKFCFMIIKEKNYDNDNKNNDNNNRFKLHKNHYLKVF